MIPLLDFSRCGRNTFRDREFLKKAKTPKLSPCKASFRGFQPDWGLAALISGCDALAVDLMAAIRSSVIQVAIVPKLLNTGRSQFLFPIETRLKNWPDCQLPLGPLSLKNIP